VERRLAAAGRGRLAVGVRIGLGRDAPAASAAEKSHPLGDDLGYVTLLAVFIIVRARANAAFDVRLPPLGEILTAGLALFAPDDDVMPLGSFLPVALGVVPDLAGRDRKARHGAAVRGVAHLGVFAEIAD